MKSKNQKLNEVNGDVEVSCPMCGIKKKVHVEFEAGETLISFTFRCPRSSCGASRVMNLTRGQVKGKEKADYL